MFSCATYFLMLVGVIEEQASCLFPGSPFNYCVYSYPKNEVLFQFIYRRKAHYKDLAPFSSFTCPSFVGMLLI
uniref:Secreted protein n=1 Tax=Hordeum vulgare subsp. vulgare TaxID=112509 RepID=A0A8I6Y442_HORVV